MLEPLKIELVSRLGLVGGHIGDLIAALRIGAQRPAGRRTRKDGVLRDGADIVQCRSRSAHLVADDEVRSNLDFGVDRSDVLLDLEEIAVHEPIKSIAIDAEFGERPAGRSCGVRPIIGHAEIRQSMQVGANVIGGDLDRVDRRPLDRDEPAVAIVRGMAAAGDIGVLK